MSNVSLQENIKPLLPATFNENSYEFDCANYNTHSSGLTCMSYKSLKMLGGKLTTKLDSAENRIIKTTPPPAEPSEEVLSPQHIASLEKSVNNQSRMVQLLTKSISQMNDASSNWFNTGGGAVEEIITTTTESTTTESTTTITTPQITTTDYWGDQESEEEEFGSGSGSGDYDFSVESIVSTPDCFDWD